MTQTAQPVRYQSAFQEHPVALKTITVPTQLSNHSEEYVSAFSRNWNADIRNDDKNCWIYSWFTPLVIVLITAIAAIIVRDYFPRTSLRDTVIASISLIGAACAIAAFIRLTALGPCGGCHRAEECNDARTEKIQEITIAELNRKFTSK